MYQAIGVIELKSIAKGIEATDAALKSAGVSVVTAHAACPGKYEIILTGTISNVTSAVEHVKSRFDEKLVDSSIMGRIDPQVITALFGTAPSDKKGSLGIIGTQEQNRSNLTGKGCPERHGKGCHHFSEPGAGRGSDPLASFFLSANLPPDSKLDYGLY